LLKDFLAKKVIKNATKELKRLSQNGFQERLQQFYRRWQKCIFAQENGVKEI
jgi:hypothetical protein